MFPVRKYGVVLDEMAKTRGIETLFGTELVAVDGPARRATFRDIKTGAPPRLSPPARPRRACRRRYRRTHPRRATGRADAPR
jgi:hypothetical protein